MRKHGASLDSAFLLSWKTKLGLKSMFASLLWRRFRFNKARDEPEVVGPGFLYSPVQLSLYGLSQPSAQES